MTALVEATAGMMRLTTPATTHNVIQTPSNSVVFLFTMGHVCQPDTMLSKQHKTHSGLLLIKVSVCPPHTVPSICSPRTMYAHHTIPVAILSRCTGLGPKEFTSELRSAWILTGQPCGACKGQHLLTFSSFSWL